MKTYKSTISLVQNERGIWDLDPFKGCYFWTLKHKNGCYWLCYAARIARSRWYDFAKVVYRNFESQKQIESIGAKLAKVPFVRLWTMCDPSHDRDHTVKIVNTIKPYISLEKIVIITKHFKLLTLEQLEDLRWTCINVSISALDTLQEINHRLRQYELFKKYWNSILRVNTCDFTSWLFPSERKIIQDMLLKRDKVIDNVLRMPKSSKYVEWLLVNVKKEDFMWKTVYASKHDKDVFMWKCGDCIEQCGVGM